MDKRKVQVVIYNEKRNNKKSFLILKTNERRGYFWQNVTGGVDENESFNDAALREAKEETAITDDNILSIIETDLEFRFFDQWKKNVIEKVFILKVKSEWEVLIDQSEHSDYKWIDEDNISIDSLKYESNWNAIEKVL